MYPLDAVTTAALLSSHTAVARLTSLTPDGSTVRRIWDLDERILLDGSVDYDRTREVRRSCRLSLVNADGLLSPHQPGDYFFPGERIRVERGVTLPGGGVSWIPLFEGPVRSFDASMAGVLSLDAEDPLSALQQPFGEEMTVEDAMPAADALRALWEPVLGAAAFGDLDDGGRVVALRTWAEDEDRLSAGVSLMSDLGLEVFADRFGKVVLRPRPDPTSADAVAVVRDFIEPDPGEASLLDLTRSSSDRPYNRQVALSERPDLPTLRAVAEVTDPASPIHADRIGLQVAPYYRSSQIGDQAALNAVAQQLLIELALNVDSTRGSAIPDPRLDEGDVVTMRDDVSGTDDRYRIDRLGHPVTLGSMTIDASRVLPIFLLAAA